MREQFAGPHVDVEKAIAFWLMRATVAVRTEMYRAFRVIGLEMTPEQWEVLARLWATDGVSQNELCRLTHKDKPTMSRILDGMERRGWLKRSVAASDGRQRLIKLTARGRNLEAEALPVARRMVRKLEHGFTEPALKTLRRNLRTITLNLETQD